MMHWICIENPSGARRATHKILCPSAKPRENAMRDECHTVEINAQHAIDCLSRRGQVGVRSVDSRQGGKRRLEPRQC